MARLTELRLSAASSVASPATERRPYPHHLTGRPSNNRHTAQNFATRFWRKVDKRGPEECWLWKGGHLSTGRGQVHVRWEGKKNIRASAPAVAWMLTHGPIPEHLVVCHNCPSGDDPRCVNPSHLFLGTQRENVYDSIYKNRRNAFGRQRLTVENVIEIRARAARGETQKSIAASFGVRRHTISGVVNRRSWAHVPQSDLVAVVFERVPHVNLPVKGILHLDQSTEPRNSVARRFA